MKRSTIALTCLALGLTLTLSNVQAQENVDVSISQERQISLDDKLNEAVEKEAPVIVIFGKGSNPDLHDLAGRISENNQNSDKPSILLVIDPSLEPADSALAPVIKEHLNPAFDLHTAVLPVVKGKNGKPQVGQPTFIAEGYSFDTPDRVSKSLPVARGAMSAGNINQGNTATVGGGNQNPQPQSTPPATTAQPSASDLKHVVAGHTTIEAARNELLQKAKTHGLDVNRATVRTGEFEASARHHNLDDKQVIATYEAITALLESTKSGPLFDDATRKVLCELTLHNVARPRSISQGSHPTCNVTTLEVYIACRYPEIYADMVSQVVLTGSYETIFSELITPPKQAYLPGDDEKNFDMDAGTINKRNHASQIVEMTLVNGVYETGRYHVEKDSKGNKLDKTGWRYIVGPPQKTWFRVTGNQWAYTTDEDQLLNQHGQPAKDRNGKIIRSPELIGDDILAASEMAIGYKMPYLDAPYQITGQPWVYDLPTASRLLKYKADGELPLGVHTMGGMHVQTIHDVIEKNGQCWILIDNQRGESDDGWITLSTLHNTQKSMNYHFKPNKHIP